MTTKSRLNGLNIKNTGIDALIQKTEEAITPQKNEPVEKMSRINFDAPISLKKQMQIYCVQNNISIKNFLIDAITEQLKKD
jgi:hypothetical protein